MHLPYIHVLYVYPYMTGIAQTASSFLDFSKRLLVLVEMFDKVSDHIDAVYLNTLEVCYM